MTWFKLPDSFVWTSYQDFLLPSFKTNHHWIPFRLKQLWIWTASDGCMLLCHTPNRFCWIITNRKYYIYIYIRREINKYLHSNKIKINLTQFDLIITKFVNWEKKKCLVTHDEFNIAQSFLNIGERKEKSTKNLQVLQYAPWGRRWLYSLPMISFYSKKD